MSEVSSPKGPSSSPSPYESGNSTREPVRKSVSVRMDVYRMLHTLQLKSEPRIDMSYIASAAIEHAFGSSNGEAAIRRLALAMMRRDLDQLTH